MTPGSVPATERHSPPTSAATCTQCGQHYRCCAKCKERIIFVPKAGFGNTGEWRHLEPPVNNVGFHMPHPELVIT